MESRNNVDIEQKDIDINEFARILWRSKYLFISIFLVFILGGFLYLRYKKPVFSATSRLKIELISSVEALSGNVNGGALEIMEMEGNVAFLTSETLLRKVVENLKLSTIYYSAGRVGYSEIFSSPPFKVVLLKNTEDIKYKDKLLLVEFDESGKNFTISFEDEDSVIIQAPVGKPIANEIKIEVVDIEKVKNRAFKFIIHDKNWWIRYIKKNLNIKPSPGSVFDITVRDFNPVRSARISNEVAKQYLASEMYYKNVAYDQMLSFLDTLISKIKLELTEAEILLENYEKSKKIPIVENKKNYSTEKYFELKQEYKKLEYKLLELQSIKDFVKAHLIPKIKKRENISRLVFFTSMELPEIVVNMINEINELISQREILLESRTIENTKIINIDKKLLSLTENLITAINEAEKKIKAQKNRVEGQLRALEKEILTFPKLEREFAPLKRQYEVNVELYYNLLSKKFDVSVEKSSITSKSRILDRATPSNKPIEPNVVKVWILSFVSGLLVAFIVVIVKELMRKTIDYESDIDQYKTLPILGRISMRKTNKKTEDLASQIPVIYKPRSSIAEEFRQLRINLEFVLKKKNASNFISITSTVSGEGKSFIALNLAASLSTLNKRVVIVDLDLRKPYLHNIMPASKGNEALGVTKGAADYLAGNAVFEEIIYSTGIKNLSIVPVGMKPPNPAELLASEEVDMLIGKLRSEFDYVVIDTSPVGIVIDALPVLQKSDAVLYILRFHYSLKNFLKKPLELKQQGIISKIYLALNAVDRKQTKYGGYNYYYKYKYKYNYYYGEEEEKKWWQFWKK